MSRSASSTAVESGSVLPMIPARSKNDWLPMPPESGTSPLVVRTSAMPFREVGPWHEAAVCSQIEIIERLAPTATPDPELDPRGTRSVSYGLHD